jgi:hypothetical protein
MNKESPRHLNWWYWTSDESGLSDPKETGQARNYLPKPINRNAEYSIGWWLRDDRLEFPFSCYWVTA